MSSRHRENPEFIGNVAFEECGSEELDAALEAEPPLQSVPTPSPMGSTTTDDTLSDSSSLIQTSIILTRYASDYQGDVDGDGEDGEEDD